jgi:hypothetical protein
VRGSAKAPASFGQTRHHRPDAESGHQRADSYSDGNATTLRAARARHDTRDRGAAAHRPIPWTGLLRARVGRRGSQSGSHDGVQHSRAADAHGRAREDISHAPTDLNEPGCLRGYLRIR